MATFLCDHCGRYVGELFDVQTTEADMSGPAQIEEWCAGCCGHEVDAEYERAVERARGNNFERTNGRDWT
jgi:hypothetical protein